MDNSTPNTAERSVSRPREEIIREAQRIEEALLYTSKGHFAAAHFWTNFHLWIGIPMVVLSAIAGAKAFGKLDADGQIAGYLSIVVVVFSALMTFLNPNQKASAHLNAGNNYDALMNRVRIFSSIDCWRQESDEFLAEGLIRMSEQKDKLNQTCPQVPHFAYLIARRGIKDGEAQYAVDKK
jgi:hypothetical protein